MTLAEYDQKISNLVVVQSKATGLKKAELTSIIDDLRTARVETLTSILTAGGFGFSSEDIARLKAIADAFEEGVREIENTNELIDHAISLGKKLLSIVL